MRAGCRSFALWLGIALLTTLFLPASAWAQLGDALAGFGPINRSMGGAATAAPIDAAGSLYWNSASISGLGRSEALFGTEFLIPRSSISSRVAAGTFGPGVPPVPLAGNTGSNSGVYPLPTFALVYQPKDSPWTYGVGLFEIGGFGVNYPVSLTNPILTPQFPFGRGVGPLFSQLEIFQFAPTVAYRLTDQLSIGFAGNIDMGTLSLDPALFSPPTVFSTPLGPGLRYPAATHGPFRWGGGFQVGVFYAPECDWSFGASVKSPQWFETYRYNAISADGRPETPKFNLDFPMIASVGTAYTGIDRLLVALDLRFLDFRDTNGFRRSGFDERGALRGLGWQNVFATALGTQYELTDNFTVRGGYSFALNPIGNAVTAFNIGSPLLIQHMLSAGASYNVTKSLKISLAYMHSFQSSIQGPIVEPIVGPVPGSSVRTAATTDSVVVGASVEF